MPLKPEGFPWILDGFLVDSQFWIEVNKTWIE